MQTSPSVTVPRAAGGDGLVCNWSRGQGLQGSVLRRTLNCVGLCSVVCSCCDQAELTLDTWNKLPEEEEAIPWMEMPVRSSHCGRILVR